jgi:putative ABC transport system permease protein
MTGCGHSNVSKSNNKLPNYTHNKLIAKLLPIWHSNGSHNPMLHNYLKVAIRNLFRNRAHSLINITGLALGMAAAALLILNIQFELGIDQFHKKKDRLYQAYMKGPRNGTIDSWNSTSALVAQELRKFPEIVSVTRLSFSYELFRYKDQKIPSYGSYTDPSFLSMFSFPLTKGNVQTALANPNNIVITGDLAKRIFGNDDPIGKTINTPAGDNFVVTALLKDFPKNSSLHYDYLLSWSKLRGPFYWNNQNSLTYVELAPNADPEVVNKKISDIVSSNFLGTGRTMEDQKVFLYPFKKVYLGGRFENGKPAGGEIDNLKLMGGLAGILLLIACINFMNLSTARSEKRGKEVGIRKVIGAARPSLIAQFIGESILLAALSGLVALMIVQLALPSFSTLVRQNLAIPWQSPLFWLTALGFVLMTGVLAGSYPAFYLSSFRPVRVLKGILKNGNALVTPRKILVVVQFVFSILLINFTLIYERQFQHVLDRETGYAKDNLVYHGLTGDLRRNYAAVKNELIATGIATTVSKASGTVTDINGVESGLKWDGMDPKANPGFNLMSEDGGLIQTSGLTLIAGRDIDIAKYPDDTLSCVINETSVKALGFSNPIGQIIRDVDERWKIVGVVKDFLAGNPDQATLPLLIKGGVGDGVITIRTNPARPFTENARKTEAILKKYNAGYLTDLQFADKDYEEKFRQAKNTGVLIHVFTLIAIFVSCMGLLGLATYMAENRTREIGIRKVLGSNVSGIVTLLARDFVKLVLVSVVVASPLAWLFMEFFLRHFYYRVSPDVWVLLASGVAALFMALFTISFQVIRAALRNPVSNLRSE